MSDLCETRKLKWRRMCEIRFSFSNRSSNSKCLGVSEKKCGKKCYLFLCSPASKTQFTQAFSLPTHAFTEVSTQRRLMNKSSSFSFQQLLNSIKTWLVMYTTWQSPWKNTHGKPLKSTPLLRPHVTQKLYCVSLAHPAWEGFYAMARWAMSLASRTWKQG